MTAKHTDTTFSLLFFLIFSLTVTAASLKAQSSGQYVSFKGLSEKTYLYGPKLTQSDLQGKIVLIQAWPVQFTNPVKKFKLLQEIHNKYSKTGKFVIIANLVAGRDIFSKKQILNFLQKQKVTFPVLINLRDVAFSMDTGVCSGAILIGYDGKIAARNNDISLLVPQIEPLLMDTSSSIVGNTKVKYCKSLVEKLNSGKNITATFKRLKRMAKAKTAKGKEAYEIVAHVEEWLKDHNEYLLKKAAEEPSTALDDLLEYSKLINGLQYNVDIENKIKELQDDISLKKLIKLKPEVERYKWILNEKYRTHAYSIEKAKKQIERTKKSLNKLLLKNSTSPAVANETKKLIETCDKILKVKASEK